jgi:hypothetical protein
MTDDLDGRLRSRLLALEDSLPVQLVQGNSTNGPDRSSPVAWRALPGGALAMLTVGTLAVVAILSVAHFAGGGPTKSLGTTSLQSASPSSEPRITLGIPSPSAVNEQSLGTSSGPSVGIARDVAVAMARSDLDGGAVTLGPLRSAVSGFFADVSTGALAGAVKPDRMVWAVTFDATASLCPPDGSACSTSPPGAITLYLDYYTGEVLAGSGHYPTPS